jgi:endonuclease/exonuclease/phosphatase (EEP) superfamily protein YafD
MDNSYIFGNYEAFFLQFDIIFNTLLPVFKETLCIIVVKFCALTSGHISKTLFQFIVICKMTSMWCILYRAKQVVVRWYQIWAVSSMGENSPFHFHDCATCVQAGVRLGIVMREKDYFSCFG